MSFERITWNQKMEKMHNYFTSIQRSLKLRIWANNVDTEKNFEKGIRLMTSELDGAIMAKFAASWYSYIADNTDKNKKYRRWKKCLIRQKRKFDDHLPKK